jgi:hypothetical protein
VGHSQVGPEAFLGGVKHFLVHPSNLGLDGLQTGERSTHSCSHTGCTVPAQGNIAQAQVGEVGVVDAVEDNAPCYLM